MRHLRDALTSACAATVFTALIWLLSSGVGSFIALGWWHIADSFTGRGVLVIVWIVSWFATLDRNVWLER